MRKTDVLMGKSLLKSGILLFIWFLPGMLLAQNTDCRTSIVICSDQSFSFLPSGRGIDDFANPNNDQGCLFTRETISAWFYFEFREDMPPNSELTFEILDTLRDFKVDYDFAVYGEDVNCDDLGSPIRCSFARLENLGNLRPGQPVSTGLRFGETDTTESFLNVNGFLKPMTVQPGEGFFLIVDMFVSTDTTGGFESFDSTLAQSFSFDWGGPAAPFLNCIANPNCDQVVVDAGRDTIICAGTTLDLVSNAVNTAGQESYRWEGSDGATAFIDDPDARVTTATIPFDFAGEITFTSTVSEGACVHSDELRVTVDPAGEPDISGDTLVCEGESTLLTAEGGFSTYTWSDGSNGQTLNAPGSGVYQVTVTSGSGCPGIAEITVFNFPVPDPVIEGPGGFCPGGEANLRAIDGFVSYEWSTGETTQEITVDQPGEVMLTLVDTFGCTVERMASVDQFTNPVPAIEGPRAICSGDVANLRGEDGYLSYDWSTGETEQEVTYNVADTYTLTVIDTNGCRGSSNITITEREDPVATISGDSPFCSNETSLLTATPGYIGYNWSTGDSLPSIEVGSPGNIGVTVTDQFGCRGQAMINVDTFSAPRPDFDNPDYFCEGSGLTLRLDASYANYEWSTGENTETIQVTEPSTYQVTVEDANGCFGNGVLDITEAANPNPVIQGQDRLCPGDETTLSTANAYVTYQWSTGDNTPTITTDRSDTYTVEVVDELGCEGEGSITLIPLSAPVVRISGLDAICQGDEATLIANSGFRQYRWSTGSPTQAITVDEPGDYGVTVTDENGCQAFESVTFDVNPNPKPRIDGNLRLCEGETTRIQVQGGSFADYRWSTGDSTFAIDVAVEEDYAVTVTTAAGCQNSDTVFVEAFRPIPSPLAGGEVALCEGETVTLDAGPGFIDYSWSTGDQSQSIEVTEGGVYELVVLDSNICLSETDILVREFQVEDPTIIGQAAFCSGQRNTLIAGGNFRLYEWSTGQTGKSIQIDTGGLYSVTVTDNNGCVSMVSRNILEEESPDIDIAGTTTLCDEDTVTLSVDDGYSGYLWTNNEQTTSITVTEPGRYGVLVFGSNGCASSDEVVVQQRSTPLVGIDGPQNICSNDSATLDPGPQYESYAWSTGDTSQTVTVRRAGIYELNVVDRFGCPGFARAQLQVRRAPDFDIEGPRNLCEGDTLQLVVGSDSLYRDYQWSTGSREPELEVLAPGTYSVSVTATNDCVTEDSVTVNPLLSPEPSILGDPFFCEGGFTLLEADTTYAAYQWGGGRTSSSIRITTPGPYELEVITDDGCSGFDTLEVTELALPMADAGPDTLLNCYAGTILLGTPVNNADGRFLPTWTGPGITDSTRNQFQPALMTAGQYALEVRDTLFGCTMDADQVTVADERYVPELSLATPDTINCRDSSITLTASAEMGPSIGYRWINLDINQNLGSDVQIEVDRGGSYQFELLDTLTGCSRVDTIEVLADQALPLLRENPIGSINCRKDSQILIVQQPPAGELWSYGWERSDGTFFPGSIDSLRRTVYQPGVYRVRIENTANGCALIDSLQVRDDRTGPDVTAGPDEELDCTLTEVTLGGPVTNDRWELSWSQVEDLSFASGLPQPVVDVPGTYVLYAFDPRTGCDVVDTAIISQYEMAPDSFQLSVQNVVCYGERNGAIRVNEVFGGEGPLLYSLNDRPFSSVSQFTNLDAGLYNLTVQDARGCELSQRIIVGPGNDVFVDLGPDQYIRQGDRARVRALTSIPDGEVGDLRWTVPDTLSCDTCVIQTLRPLETIQLRAFAVDTNGCRGEDVVTIFVDKRKRVYIPTAFSPDGDGLNDVIMIYAARDVERIKVWRIFDRWGELVFEREDFPANDPAFGWDGQWRNALQQKRKIEDRLTLMNAQVFVYYAEVEFIDGETMQFKGDFTLVK